MILIPITWWVWKLRLPIPPALLIGLFNRLPLTLRLNRASTLLFVLKLPFPHTHIALFSIGFKSFSPSFPLLVTSLATLCILLRYSLSSFLGRRVQIIPSAASFLI